MFIFVSLMAIEDNKKKKLIKKLMNPYRLVVVNEETFEEQFQVGLSRLNLIVFLILTFTIFSLSVFFVVSYTPLKEYIPGYDSSKIRKKAVENLFLTDSLISIYKKNQQYLNIIRGVLSDNLVFKEDPNPNFSENNLTIKKNSIRNNMTSADSVLRDLVSREDKFNVIKNARLSEELFLIVPAKGIISQAYDQNNKHFAVDIALEEGTPIKSVANGTIVFAEYTAQTGYVIMVEHDLGMLSVYKHNSILNKEQGDIVAAGEVIAQAGNTGEYSTGWHLHFELWIDGYSLDPELFFDFEK